MKAWIANIKTVALTYFLPVLLILSAINLALMVPGGFVENRHFPGYSVVVLSAFNIFLTLLGLGSFALAYRVLRLRRTGITPVLTGVAYVLVYYLDLFHIFPVADSPMSTTLVMMEWAGMLLGLATIATGLAAISSRPADSVLPPFIVPRGLLLTLAAIVLVIVIFATLSAR